ncbi:MAG: RNA polymerase sigma factor [Actinomycetota bacterium]
MVMSRSRTDFQRLAREQLPFLYALARRLAGEGAEDVVQDCLMKAYRRFDDLRDIEAAPGWFRTILLNSVRDRYRRESAGPDETPIEDVSDYSLYRKIADEDPWPYSDSVHVDFLHSFNEEDVWAVLDRLSPKYRIPLVLVHMEGMEVEDVTRMLGTPRNTVLSWLHRGRKHFEKELWEYAVDNGLLKEKAISK